MSPSRGLTNSTTSVSERIRNWVPQSLQRISPPGSAVVPVTQNAVLPPQYDPGLTLIKARWDAWTPPADSAIWWSDDTCSSPALDLLYPSASFPSPSPESSFTKLQRMTSLKRKSVKREALSIAKVSKLQHASSPRNSILGEATTPDSQPEARPLLEDDHIATAILGFLQDNPDAGGENVVHHNADPPLFDLDELASEDLGPAQTTPLWRDNLFDDTALTDVTATTPTPEKNTASRQLLTRHDSFISTPPARNDEHFATSPSVHDAHSCNVCGIRFTTNKDLENHAELKDHRSFRCKEPGCTHTCHRMDLLKRHRHSHKARKEFECKFCDDHRGFDAFKRRDALNEHMKRRHPRQWSDQLIKHCPHPECEYSKSGFRFTSGAQYRSHMAQKHGEGKKDCPVLGCKRTGKDGYLRDIDLQKHVTSKHSEEQCLSLAPGFQESDPMSSGV